jgi:putative FmdB family regulatory protein
VPVYEFDCPDCGRFDTQRQMREATTPIACPSCEQPSRRVYTAPGIRSRTGPLAGAGRLDAARIDRARTGEPVITGPPAGRRVPQAAPHRHR